MLILSLYNNVLMVMERARRWSNPSATVTVCPFGSTTYRPPSLNLSLSLSLSPTRHYIQHTVISKQFGGPIVLYIDRAYANRLP